MKFSRLLAAVASLTLVFAPALAGNESIEGKWSGVATAPPDPGIPFAVSFEKTEGTLKATMDIPSLGLVVELTDVTFDGSTLKFVVPIPEAPADCTGEVQQDGSILGTFDQAGVTGSFEMKHSK